MKSQELAKEIQVLEAEFLRLFKQLNELIPPFGAFAAKSAGEWIKAEVESVKINQAEELEKLTDAEFNSFKAKIDELVSGLPEIAQKEVSDSTQWPHAKYAVNSSIINGHEEHFFNKTFRSLISRLGNILHEHGLIKNVAQQHTWEVRSGYVRYAMNPGWDKFKDKSMTDYSSIYSEFTATSGRIGQKKRELAQVRTSERWDAAS